MMASVSSLVILKIFRVVADVGDKNGLECGGCSPAYLEVLRSMGLLFHSCVSWVPAFLERELQECLASLG